LFSPVFIVCAPWEAARVRTSYFLSDKIHEHRRLKIVFSSNAPCLQDYHLFTAIIVAAENLCNGRFAAYKSGRLTRSDQAQGFTFIATGETEIALRPSIGKL
jgi:hypothetical protein